MEETNNSNPRVGQNTVAEAPEVVADAPVVESQPEVVAEAPVVESQETVAETVATPEVVADAPVDNAGEATGAVAEGTV